MEQNQIEQNLVVRDSIQHEMQQSKFISSFQIIDLFSFLPIPKTNKVSTKRSIIGSIILIIIFVSYLITTLVQFIKSNAPKIASLNIPIDDNLYNVPDFAINFVYGDDLTVAFEDERYFTFQFQQVTVFKDTSQQRKYENKNLTNCDKNKLKEWMGKLNYNKILCPSEQTKMQGNLYSSDIHKYARIVMYRCNSNLRGDCVNDTELNRVLGGGRIFLFVRKDKQVDVLKQQKENILNQFNLLNFFVINGIYQRNEIVMRLNKDIIHPDLLTRFEDQLYSSLNLEKNFYYQSKVPNATSLYLIWFRIDQDVNFQEFFFKSSIELISQWGALWGVLFALFAFYLMRFNENKFYKNNQDWEDFHKDYYILQQKNKQMLQEIEIYKSKITFYRQQSKNHNGDEDDFDDFKYSNKSLISDSQIEIKK